MYASLSAGIKNSKSPFSTDGIRLYATSVVSWTNEYTGLDTKISNSELMDAVSAYLAGERRMTFRTICLFVKLGLFSFPFASRCVFALRPRPSNFCIRFCVDPATCLEKMSRVLTSGIYFRLYQSKCYLWRVLPHALKLWHHSKA
jgi:hypothetical protein